MTVTFFGHRDAPKEIEPTLRTTLINLIEQEKAREFYVGNNGNFDAMVRRQLEDLSKAYEINFTVVLAYLPDERRENYRLTNTIYPEGIESVPKRFAISWRNKWMLRQADTVITYTTHPSSGAWEFEQLALKQGKRVVQLFHCFTTEF